MGGGTMLPAMAGGYGGGGATATSPRTMPNCRRFQSYQYPSVLSRTPFRPPLTGSGGLAEACHENLHFNGGDTEELPKRWYFDSGFWPTPSRMEVETALFQLQRSGCRLWPSFCNFREIVCRRVPGVVEALPAKLKSSKYMDSKISEFERLEQVFSPTDSRMLQVPAYGRLNRAFDLFQKDPAMQSMVMSISCDKAVWDAIINNKAVKELQGSLAAAKQEQAEGNTTEVDIVNLIVKWITGFTKSKVAEMIEKFFELVAKIFGPGEKEKPTSELTYIVEEKIRSSMLLSVVILLIVIVTRNHGA